MFYGTRWYLTTPKVCCFNTKGQLGKANGLLHKHDKPCDLKPKLTHTLTYIHSVAPIFYPQGSFSSDPEPRTLKAISNRLLCQFPVTGVILSLKKDGCSHNNLHGSYQTHHHCHWKKETIPIIWYSSFPFFPPPGPSGDISNSSRPKQKKWDAWNDVENMTNTVSTIKSEWKRKACNVLSVSNSTLVYLTLRLPCLCSSSSVKFR